VYDQVLARRPSNAKNPYANMRQHLRFDAPRLGWVWLGGGEIVPLRVVLEGLRFRLIPSGQEIEEGALLWHNMRPFVPYQFVDMMFEDAQGRRITAHETSVQLGEGVFGPVAMPAVELGTWFQQSGFARGDSVLVTVRSAAPLTFRIEREPAASFRAAEVAAQERALLDALAEYVKKAQRNMLASDETVLAIYARAPWRTAYPARPWQLLVESDRRLRLLDGEHIADARFHRPLDMLFGDGRDEQFWEQNDSALLQEIAAFQEQLRQSRQEAVERGLWDGTVPRVSTARTVFDVERGTSTTIYPGAVDGLADHTAEIEEHVARGDYQREELSSGDDDYGDMDFDEDMAFDAELDELDDIEDIQAFVEQNPEIADATRRLMESLSPEEMLRLEDAQSLDDVQQVLGPRLNEMLRTEPALFVPLEPPTLDSFQSDGNGNGNSNGNGHSIKGDPELLSNEGWVEDTTPLGASLDEDWDAEEPEFGESDADIDAAMERSNSLMEQFVAFQQQQGKSDTTTMNRAQDMWLYADFLGRYYGRSLDQGDYATLDECLFFYYPRKVLNSSPRAARELCTSIKQFYAYLKMQKIITDDAFALGIWQRRDQAARLVELYDQIDGDSPQFERLFAHLFAPYTA
jgi:hypothetical protein